MYLIIILTIEINNNNNNNNKNDIVWLILSVLFPIAAMCRSTCRKVEFPALSKLSKLLHA